MSSKSKAMSPSHIRGQRGHSRSRTHSRDKRTSKVRNYDRESRERGSTDRDRSRKIKPRYRTRSRSGNRSRSRSEQKRKSPARHVSRSHSRSKSCEKRRSRSRNMNGSSNPLPTCLGVFGLNTSTSEPQIYEIFSKFGPIERVHVIYDAQSGRSRGYCFVYYEMHEDAKTAREQCTGMELDGRRIRVDFSITQQAHSPTPGIYKGNPIRAYRNRDRGGRFNDRDRDFRNRSTRNDFDRDRRDRDRHSRRSPSPYNRANNRDKDRDRRRRSRSYSPAPRNRRYR